MKLNSLQYCYKNEKPKQCRIAFKSLNIKITIKTYKNKHTHIIGHYNSAVGIIDLVSHTTYIMCINFILKWWDLQFKVDYERQILYETFHDNFI